MIAAVREVIRYRELVLNLVRRDIKRRYKGSMLGFLWHLMNPLLILGTLWFVFGVMVQRIVGMEAYAVYLLSALVAWNLFSQSVLNASSNLVTSGGLIRKVYVPKSVFPLASVGGGIVNYLLSLLPLLLLVAIDRRPLGWSLLFLPVGLLLLIIFTTGMALLVSGLNVFYRDVQHITEVVFLAWFYASPIIWPTSIDSRLFVISAANPMAALIDCVRAPIYSGAMPPWASLELAVVSSLGVFVVGAMVFRRLEPRFIHHL